MAEESGWDPQDGHPTKPTAGSVFSWGSKLLQIHVATKITCTSPADSPHRLWTYIWTPECNQAFQEMKALLAHDAINTFANLEEPFHIYTDASDYQLSAAILQNDRPIAYWSKKLNKTQRDCTTMEKELLAVVLSLKEYRNMLYGGKINIYTDHKNLIFRTLSQSQVLR